MENKNKIQKFKKEKKNRILLLKGQEINQKELRLGFIGLEEQANWKPLLQN